MRKKVMQYRKLKLEYNFPRDRDETRFYSGMTYQGSAKYSCLRCRCFVAYHTVPNSSNTGNCNSLTYSLADSTGLSVTFPMKSWGSGHKIGGLNTYLDLNIGYLGGSHYK